MPAYRFMKNDNGNDTLSLSLPAGRYEFKLTRGNWAKVECNKDGTGTGNRSLQVESDTLISLSVSGWQDRFGAPVKKTTASRNVRIIDTAFFMPQLNRYRRVWIYLPPDYKKSTCPVIYMHDGQNLFEDSSSYAGEWGIDEFLDTARMKDCIVVGIDHGGARRTNEYCPYDMERFGKGEGDRYLEFIVRTLKPYIDRTYFPLRDRDHTFIGGSSMGGLISMYALLKYPKIFGGAGIFSPAFWVGPGIFRDIKRKGCKVKARIYFYAGKSESESMVPDMLKAMTGMAAVSKKTKMTTVIRDAGRHNEQTWRREFPLFYEWLMYGNTKGPVMTDILSNVTRPE